MYTLEPILEESNEISKANARHICSLLTQKNQIEIMKKEKINWIEQSKEWDEMPQSMNEISNSKDPGIQIHTMDVLHIFRLLINLILFPFLHSFRHSLVLHFWGLSMLVFGMCGNESDNMVLALKYNKPRPLIIIFAFHSIFHLTLFIDRQHIFFVIHILNHSSVSIFRLSFCKKYNRIIIATAKPIFEILLRIYHWEPPFTQFCFA